MWSSIRLQFSYWCLQRSTRKYQIHLAKVVPRCLSIRRVLHFLCSKPSHWGFCDFQDYSERFCGYLTCDHLFESLQVFINMQTKSNQSQASVLFDNESVGSSTWVPYLGYFLQRLAASTLTILWYQLPKLHCLQLRSTWVELPDRSYFVF